MLAGGGALTRAEVAAVRATVPFTAPMTAPTLPLDPAEPAGPQVPAPLALLERPAGWMARCSRAPVTEAAHPVVGLYLVAGAPAGYLTRMGGPITDRGAHMVATYVRAGG